MPAEQRQDDLAHRAEAVRPQRQRSFVQALVQLAHCRNPAAYADRHVAEDEAGDQDQAEPVISSGGRLKAMM